MQWQAMVLLTPPALAAAGVVYVPVWPLLPPMFAGAAMALSSITVVGNALRLKRFK